jgi:hypothetical protein
MWYYNYYIALLILAIIFFFISNKNIQILLSIIIIFIIGYYYFNKINEFNIINKMNEDNIIKSLNSDIKDRQYISNDNYYLKKFPEKIKYLYKDKTLLNIVTNIRFIKKYDYDKYTNIVYQIDKLYKIYIFILANRYDVNIYFNTFILLRNTILKDLYSIYIILPMKMKFFYGFNSFDELKKSILDFTSYSRKLITIIERFAKQEKNIYYLQDTKYKPFDNNIHDIY